MSSPTRWHWIRHAPVTAAGGRIYGQQDMPADTSEVAVYAGLARKLPADAVLVTSHLVRTHQTAAAIVNAGLAMPEAIVEADLAEQNFGDWQGKHHAEVHGELGERHPFWLNAADHRPPNGESFTHVCNRVAAVVERLTGRFAGKDIVCVAHGGTIRAALAMAVGVTPEQALAFSVHNCSITELAHLADHGAWAIARINERPA